MRTDNNEHKALFSIPTAAHSSALANIKPLPEQRRITGHKQTDAYLWVLEVIRLNEPAHLDAAEAALEKIKISPKEAEERYSRYLLANGGDPFQVAFGTIGMDNPARAIENARKNIRKAADVRATFGSYEVAMEDVEAERIIKSSAKFIDDYDWGWTPEELEAGHIGCGRMFEIEDQRRVMVDGYRDVLPEPHTLSDVVREFIYWDWLYQVRHTAGRELGYEYGYSEHHKSVYDRERYLEKLLATIKPVTRAEAVEVCSWFLASGKDEYMEDNGAAVILNLVGECEQ
ncbi:helix-turn-helix domain-containing protein [Salmonella enterica]|uniref:Helix-turn-helix domain-containing protein n=1 Tax=Salmonella enterica TaxID=28901 RepID=A0A3J3C537_SALER|nr:helix-turn-helix domain-containing protein [Salmonella enterica]ECU4770268.1 helix-turn-helix domain-containing protein [Salmonella enterica subsp. enterica]EDP9433270.1 helix-turn-helix domain-containing protein [Salmonella enterica subsp. diarizonae]EDQ1018129.1 helix-turn-helix domain-containing protein [Salmonella enterica subsp. houtenae serovar 50:z4,z23:-]EDV3253440.1 helix-turn-helix domain-containing protein [Salmonella enterica subsp. houtenae]EDW0441254.1 helix-turn-helix domain-